MVKEVWEEKGYIDEPVDKNVDLKKEIRRLCKEKDAIILAHYYTVGDIQDIADFVGDSLALSCPSLRRRLLIPYIRSSPDLFFSSSARSSHDSELDVALQ